MDEDELREIKETHWGGLARRATASGSQSVGLMSGGHHRVQLELENLAALGIEGWIEKVEREPGSRPTFNVKISTTDLPKLFDTSPLETPRDRVASELDDAEHEAWCRRERPWVELWWEDSGPGEFESKLRTTMTWAQAQWLRDWVVANRPTMRAIASMVRNEFSHVWKMDWFQPGHQEIGYVISDVAAAMFGEDGHSPPWN